MTISRIIYGLLAIAGGVIALKYNYQLVGFTGRQDWIESKLGPGSTYTVYKLLGVVLVLGGILYGTNLAHAVLAPVLDPIKAFFPQH